MRSHLVESGAGLPSALVTSASDSVEPVLKKQKTGDLSSGDIGMQVEGEARCA
jgi:hypothetical protein